VGFPAQHAWKRARGHRALPLGGWLVDGHEEMRKRRNGSLSADVTEIVVTTRTQTEHLPFLQGHTWRPERYPCGRDAMSLIKEVTARRTESTCSYAGHVGPKSRHNHAHDGRRCDVVIKDTDAMTPLINPFLRHSLRTREL